MTDRLIGQLDFTDGTRRPVYEQPDGRQYVHDLDGELVYGIWIISEEDLADVPAIVEQPG